MKKIFSIAIMVMVACSVEPEETATVEVEPYTRTPRITEEMSWKIEWEDGPIKKWSAQVMNDTVTIERRGWCGDECGEIYNLVLVDEQSSLPRFVSCTYTANHYFPEELTITDSLVAGVIEIQDWDLDGVISGRVQGEWLQGDSVSFIFWVNHAKNGQVWVTIDPIQCLGNAWEQDWLASHGNDYDAYPRYEENRLSIFREFYEKQGVAIYKTKVNIIYEDVCAACGCPTGERIHCLIDEADLPAMLDWGFV